MRVQDIDEAEGIAAVHEAFKLGINLFDTSPFYGSTRSEAVLGRALASLPRNEIVVATKVGRYGPEEFDFSKERVTREFEASLGRLGLEYVDILQCHDIEFADLDQVLPPAPPPPLMHACTYPLLPQHRCSHHSSGGYSISPAGVSPSADFLRLCSAHYPSVECHIGSPCFRL